MNALITGQAFTSLLSLRSRALQAGVAPVILSAAHSGLSLGSLQVSGPSASTKPKEVAQQPAQESPRAADDAAVVPHTQVRLVVKEQVIVLQQCCTAC